MKMNQRIKQLPIIMAFCVITMLCLAPQVIPTSASTTSFHKEVPYTGGYGSPLTNFGGWLYSESGNSYVEGYRTDPGSGAAYAHFSKIKIKWDSGCTNLLAMVYLQKITVYCIFSVGSTSATWSFVLNSGDVLSPEGATPQNDYSPWGFTGEMVRYPNIRVYGSGNVYFDIWLKLDYLSRSWWNPNWTPGTAYTPVAGTCSVYCGYVYPAGPY
ncbi:MAG: hypothetical protein ACFFD4_24355 [Candidatus Odinarchaeota archaeon]